jgi:serine/threonine-protein kinase HipA
MDTMALTLNGSTRWPSAKDLLRLGETRVGCTPARAKQLLRNVEGGMLETTKAVQSYVQGHPEFSEIGGRMLTEWEKGIALSLREG